MDNRLTMSVKPMVSRFVVHSLNQPAEMECLLTLKIKQTTVTV